MRVERRALVTGPTGFIGKHVCSALIHDGWNVYGLSRGRRALPPAVQEVRGDLSDSRSLARAVRDVDLVVHLAARVHVMKETSPEPLAEFRRVNVDGTARLLDEAARAGVERLVFFSSVKAAGETSMTVLTEDQPPAPVDPYGQSKLEAERLLLSQSAVPITVLRLPVVYGPGMGGNMLRLFRLVDRGFPLPFGSLRNRRSIAYAGTVAAAVLAVVRAREATGEIFYVADRSAPTVRELVLAIAGALGKSAVLIPVPEVMLEAAIAASESLSRRLPVPSIGPILRRFADPLVVSIEKLERLTGFLPPYSLTDGLAETAGWYRTL